MRLTKDAQDRLAAHRWPGNVRELEHAIERAVVMAPSDAITGDLLGMGVPREGVDRANGDGDGHGHGDGDAHEAADGVHLPLGLPLEEVERRYVEATLAAMKGNRTRAAHALGVGRNTLKRKTRRS